ncbi:MAG TPA: VWA domain-containing protein [Pyrinomonadaceae bacterium]|nr:VWA domain-containing protein [Pyrinomonadaceae bacterium]
MRPSPRWLCQIVILAAVTGSSAASGQVLQNTPVPQDSAVSLRSSTRLVQLNVVVQNRKGEPVHNLTRDHFTLFDQGVPQKIAVFSVQSAAPGKPTPAGATASNIFSNRFDQAGQPAGSVTVILFDALNTPILDQSRAREQVVKFLRQLQPQDHVALYILTTRIITVNEFTQDAGSLLKAIAKFGGYSSVQLDASNAESRNEIAAQAAALDVERMSTQLKEFLRGGDGQISDFANIDRALTTTSALEAIANHVARIPGRKNLIWVSGSFPISIGYDSETLMQVNREHRSFEPELEHAARALDQADMAVYPVDARGLMVSPLFNASNSTGMSARTPPRPGDLGPNPDNFFTMTTLADRTGGRAFYNTNDIEGAIQRAIGDGEYTYTIGFYPSHGKWDGKFHELKVRVEDKGVNLRYRKGYFATPEPKDQTADNQENLDAAIRSPVEWTNLDLQVTLRTIDTASRALTLQVAFDTHELRFAQKDGRQSGKMYVLFQQLGEGSKQLSSEKETFDMNFKPETYEKLLQIGTNFSGQIVLAPDVISLRVIGQDASSGAIGTVIIRIKQILAAKTAPPVPVAGPKSVANPN